MEVLSELEAGHGFNVKRLSNILLILEVFSANFHCKANHHFVLRSWKTSLPTVSAQTSEPVNISVSLA